METNYVGRADALQRLEPGAEPGVRNLEYNLE